MQRAVPTIEEGVFSMDPPRDYINQKSVVEREREWRESSTIKEEE
jgi:hypothetical protein